MKNFILTIDQGTTGTTAVLVDAKNFSVKGQAEQDFKQIYPKPSWVEHNLNDIWSTVSLTVKKVLKQNKVKGDQIIGIGLTNQRETTCAFNKKGNPLCNAIVWQDRRTIDFCHSLQEQKLQELIKRKTGLPIDPYFSASKMNWLLQNNKKVQEAQQKDDLRFGTIDTFLLYKLSGGSAYATEPSNASRTMLMDLKTFNWDAELLNIFQLNTKILPSIQDSFSVFGKTQGLDFLPDNIPVTGILGDQQSALFGQAGVELGDMKCTYGTGAFMLLNTAEKLTYSQNGLLTTALYGHQGRKFYALEGSCYIAGAAVQWVRDNLKIIKKSADIEKLASQAKDLSKLEHLLFLPFFAGLASPHWRPEGKAALIGMTRDTENAAIARATLEGVALSINDLINAFASDLNQKLNRLNVDGGMSMNNLFLQIQSNVGQLQIVRPKNIETTAYGAALAAAVGLNILEIDQIKKLWKKDKEFAPEIKSSSYYALKKDLWEKFIKRIYL